jgi:hypothetical protein
MNWRPGCCMSRTTDSRFLIQPSTASVDTSEPFSLMASSASALPSITASGTMYCQGGEGFSARQRLASKRGLDFSRVSIRVLEVSIRFSGFQWSFK